MKRQTHILLALMVLALSINARAQQALTTQTALVRPNAVRRVIYERC